MRLQIQELSKHLKNNLAPLYFIWGEEPLQRIEALDLIRAEAIKQGYTEREVLDLSSADEHQVDVTLNTASLFGGQRLIECRLKEDKITKTTEHILSKILACISSDKIFILFYPAKLEYAAFKSSWFLSLEKNGITLAAQPLVKDQYLRFIQTRCQNLNIHLDKDALNLIFEKTEGNLIACANLLERLSLSSGVSLSGSDSNKSPQVSNISTQDILASLSDSNIAPSIFEWVDTLLLGDSARTFRMLHSLNNMNGQEALVLWAITKEVRILTLLLEKCEKSNGGRISESLMDSLNIWKQKRAGVLAFSKRHDLSSCYLSLHQLQKIDHLLKTWNKKAFWLELQDLCRILAGTRKTSQNSSEEKNAQSNV